MSDEHRVLAIDIGIQHLGLCFVTAKGDFLDPQVVGLELVNLQELDKSLTPYSTNYAADWVSRLIKKYQEWFTTSTCVLIEKQPINGFMTVEQLLLFSHRDKAFIVIPAALHSYYGLTRAGDLDPDFDHSNFDTLTEPPPLDKAEPKENDPIQLSKDKAYNIRKEETVSIGSAYLSLYGSDEAIRKFDALERKHDLADSLCFAMMYLERKGSTDRPQPGEVSEFGLGRPNRKRKAEIMSEEQIQNTRVLKAMKMVDRPSGEAALSDEQKRAVDAMLEFYGFDGLFDQRKVLLPDRKKWDECEKRPWIEEMLDIGAQAKMRGILNSVLKRHFNLRLQRIRLSGSRRRKGIKTPEYRIDKEKQRELFQTLYLDDSTRPALFRIAERHGAVREWLPSPLPSEPFIASQG